MKKFKIIDFWVSITILVIACITIFFDPFWAFCIGYFGVGTWHIISMVIHILKKCFIKKQYARYNYSITVLVIIIISLLGIIMPPIIFAVAVVMLFAAPIMVVIYCNICYKEIKSMESTM